MGDSRSTSAHLDVSADYPVGPTPEADDNPRPADHHLRPPAPIWSINLTVFLPGRAFDVNGKSQEDQAPRDRGACIPTASTSLRRLVLFFLLLLLRFLGLG